MYNIGIHTVFKHVKKVMASAEHQIASSLPASVSWDASLNLYNQYSGPEKNTMKSHLLIDSSIQNTLNELFHLWDAKVNPSAGSRTIPAGGFKPSEKDSFAKVK